MKHLLFIFCVFAAVWLQAQDISLDKKQGQSGNHYTFIKKNGCTISFETTRPSKTDGKVVLCIPAAFTNMSNDQVDGIYAVNGKIEHKAQVNKTLGGVFLIEQGRCRMFQSGQGKLFADSLYKTVETGHASFFQQIQCIRHSKASGFKDKKLFQRRGIAILEDHSIAIVESDEAISLATFSEDLVKLGVRDLMYTDMGAWDEGWYRDPESHKPVTIGKDLSQTARQSNWIVFRK